MPKLQKSSRTVGNQTVDGPGGSRIPAGGDELQAGQLDSMTEEQLVDLFLDCQKRSDSGRAHICFERIIARYQWLINHVVRNSRFKFPAWDSSDDLISRIAFKVYRGLGQWRKQGKLSSFIARIATTEMIDTIRRVGRDKSWDPNQAPQDEDSDRQSPIDRAAATGPTPEAETATREQNLIVSKLLDDVCRDWKDSVIVNEYIINCMGAKEIADKYGMSEDLVYQRARRLRVRLLKWLQDRGITTAEQLLGSAPTAAHA